MILTLVILFFILFCIQHFFEKKGKRRKVGNLSLTDKTGNTQLIDDNIKRIPSRVLVNEDFDVKIAKATKAFRDLNLKYEVGIIDQVEFNSELSKILFSIQIDDAKKPARNFTYTLHGMAS